MSTERPRLTPPRTATSRAARQALLTTTALALSGGLGVAAALGATRSDAAERDGGATVEPAEHLRGAPFERAATTERADSREPPPPTTHAATTGALAPLAPSAPGPTAAPEDAALLDRTPATPTGARILARLAAVQANARVTRYVHFARIDEELGSYLWDCSSMVSWVLRRESPRHFAALGSRRPFARDFAHLVRRSSTRYPRHGWRRVLRLRDARAGDVFSWERAQGEMATGHVGFVLAAPTPLPGREHTFAVRIADATKQPHDDDTRAAAGDTDGGLGEGTITFATDEMGRPTGYAWDSTRAVERVPARIWLGRLE